MERNSLALSAEKMMRPRPCVCICTPQRDQEGREGIEAEEVAQGVYLTSRILTNFPWSLALTSIRNFFDSISTSLLPSSSASARARAINKGLLCTSQMHAPQKKGKSLNIVIVGEATQAKDRTRQLLGE